MRSIDTTDQHSIPDRRAAVKRAVSAISRGEMVLVADDVERENEGDLVMAAELMTERDMVFFLRHGSGLVCAPMSGQLADRLQLDPMTPVNTDNHQTAFTITVDHVHSGTGISAADRLSTVRALADPRTMPSDLRRPGHVFPLRSREGGVACRRGHTEAAVELVERAGLRGVGVITELVGDDGVPLSGAELTSFAADHDIPFVTIDDLVHVDDADQDYTDGDLPLHTGDAMIPTPFGMAHVWSFSDPVGPNEHCAMVFGDISTDANPQGVLVRIHSECLTGDLLGSLRCDCGAQLQESMKLIGDHGSGILVYLRGHEGRGVGLGNKLRAYRIQDAGCDTVDANLALGLPVDSRDYGAGRSILGYLGVERIRLITNNPSKVTGMTGPKLEVTEMVCRQPHRTTHNLAYLEAKRARMGHLLTLAPGAGTHEVG